MKPVAILMPVFNDWASCAMLLGRLDEVLAGSDSAAIYIVDDGSAVENNAFEMISGGFRSLRDVHVIRLRRNLGHQRAICIGLCVIEELGEADYIVVMDADGEDAPSDVPRLLRQARENPGSITFAKRTKRSESVWFRIGYVVYKWIHRATTGEGISFGNFSVIPQSRLRALVLVSDLWTNYAAAILSSRQPYCSLPTVRARRLQGDPQMNFVRLVAHGLSAISVFGETLAVRLVVFGTVLCGAVSVIAAGAGIYFLSAGRHVSAAAALPIGLALLLGLQAAMFSVLFAFLLLNRRKETSFVPVRDYRLYIDEITAIYPAALACHDNA